MISSVGIEPRASTLHATVSAKSPFAEFFLFSHNSVELYRMHLHLVKTQLEQQSHQVKGISGYN